MGRRNSRQPAYGKHHARLAADGTQVAMCGGKCLKFQAFCGIGTIDRSKPSFEVCSGNATEVRPMLLNNNMAAERSGRPIMKATATPRDGR
jgi:hypothetical protein